LWTFSPHAPQIDNQSIDWINDDDHTQEKNLIEVLKTEVNEAPLVTPSLSNCLDEFGQIECSRFILDLAQTALEESERCRGFCGALKKLTSEVVANDQEIKNSRKWESNEPLKHLKEIQRSSKLKESPVGQIKISRKDPIQKTTQETSEHRS
jgi:hypothetical protein